MSTTTGAEGRDGPRALVFPAVNVLAAEAVAAIRAPAAFRAAHWSVVASIWQDLMPAATLPSAAAPGSPRAAVERVAAALSALVELPPIRVRRTAAAEADRMLALVAALLPAPAAAILELARAIVAVAVDGGDRAGLRPRLTALQTDVGGELRGSRRPILAAAVHRGLPWRFVGSVGDLMQLGEGSTAVRLSASGSRHTGRIAASIASDKRWASAALRRAGVPVARQVIVATADEVRRFAAAVAYPVVLKPVAMRRQQGVRFVHRPEQAANALAAALETGQAVVAESYLPGPEHRILVVDGTVLGAFERPAPTVVGDGRSTVAELVAGINADPDRGDWRAGFALAPIVLDPVALDFLASRGWHPDAVPPAGTTVECHPLPFVGYGGGRRVDSTDRIHPDNRAVAVRAAAVLELDAAGIDFRCPDIGRSWREVGAGICEVNPRPDLGAHYLPGLDRDVGARFVELRADGAGPMPQVLLVDDPCPVQRARGAAAAVGAALRRRIAAGWPGGGEFEGRNCDPGGPMLPAITAAFVENPTVDGAIYAATPRQLVEQGVGVPTLALVLLGRTARRDRQVGEMLRAAQLRTVDLPREDGALARVVAAAMASATPTLREAT